MTVNFSHIYYDGYSIAFILQKIDQVYKGEIDSYIFDIYDPKYSKYEVFINNKGISMKGGDSGKLDSIILEKSGEDYLNHELPDW